MPRRLLCPSDEASAKDGWLKSTSAPGLQELGEGTEANSLRRGQSCKQHSRASLRNVPFIDIDQ